MNIKVDGPNNPLTPYIVDYKVNPGKNKNPLSYTLLKAHISAVERNAQPNQITENERIQTLDLVNHLKFLVNAKGLTVETSRVLSNLCKSLELRNYFRVLVAVGIQFESNRAILQTAVEQYGMTGDGIGDIPYDVDSEYLIQDYTRRYIEYLLEEVLRLEEIYDLPVRNIKQKVIVGFSVKQAIRDCPNISFLAKYSKVDRSTLYNWTSEGLVYASPNLLNKLTKVFKNLTLDITSVPGKADLVVNESISEKIIRDVSNKVKEPQVTLTKTIIGENMAPNTIESNLLVNALIDNNKALLEDKAELKSQNNDLQNQIKELNIHIENLASKINPPVADLNLDHNRMMFIINMEHQTYVQTTQLYADIYGVHAFEIAKHWTWSDAIHPDDLWRFELLQLLSKEQLEQGNVWKVKANSGDSYIKTTALSLDKEGVLKKVDCQMSNEKEWQISNNWFKSFQVD